MGENPSDQAELTVVGQGEVTATPDRAVVEVGVTKRSDTARNAQEQVNLTVERVLDALEELGIDRDQIQTSRVQMNPVYSSGRREGPATREIIAYEASYSLSVRVLKLDQVGEVIDLALDGGANQLRGFRYELSDDSVYKQRALQEAVKNARDKAEAVAKASDLKISRIIEVIEAGAQIHPIEQRNVRMMAAEAAPAGTAVLPGQITVRAGVSIRFEVTPK
jgi:uncharacterized protein YggE